MCEVKEHDVGVLPVSYNIKTVFVRRLQQIVITVHYLYELSSCHSQAGVTSNTYTAVLLPDVDDIVAILHEAVHGAYLRTVVDDDDLAFRVTK